MRRLLAACRKLVEVLVDDGRLAATVLAWLTVVAVAAFHLVGQRNWLGPTLFVGLATILVVTTLRRAGLRR